MVRILCVLVVVVVPRRNRKIPLQQTTLPAGATVCEFRSSVRSHGKKCKFSMEDRRKEPLKAVESSLETLHDLTFVCLPAKKGWRASCLAQAKWVAG